MRKILYILLAALCLALPAAAQTPITVSATVTDTLGLAYSYASVQAQIIPSTASPTITIGSQAQVIQGLRTSSADVNGTFSMVLWCNTAGNGCSVISPSGTLWQFTICATGVQPPFGTGPQCFTASLNLSGASGLSQDISATLNANATRLTKGFGGLGAITYNAAKNPCTTGGASPCQEYNIPGQPACFNLKAANDATISLQNQISICNETAGVDGAYFFINSTSNHVGFGSVGFEAFTAAFGTGTAAAPVSGSAMDDPLDTSGGQILTGASFGIGLNKPNNSHPIASGVGLSIASPCNTGGCPGFPNVHETATNLFGIQIADQGNFGTTETSAIHINAQTAGGNAIVIAGTAPSVIPNPKFQSGINADGSGFKHKRVASCTTGASAGSTCTTTFSWTTGFADASYTAVCTIDTPTNVPYVLTTSSKAGASVVVTIANLTAAAASGTLNCEAVHD